jgi:serine protease AprX
MRSSALPFFICAAFAFVMNAQKLAPGLSSRAASDKVNVIVQFATAPTATEHLLVQQRGGVFYRDLSVVRSGAYSISASALQDLASEPSVTHISEDHPVHALLDNSAAAVNASAAWKQGLDGTGIGIAVIDSGITQVDDLTLADNQNENFSNFFFPWFGSNPKYRVAYRQNFLNTVSTDDFYGHGEHVSGILAGSGYDSTCFGCFRTFRGIASGANLIDLRVLDGYGNGSDSFVIAAIQKAIQLRNIYNIRVINLSLGHPIYESYMLDPLCQAVEEAWKAGIVVVVAAGNDGRDDSYGNNGYGTIGSPANDPYVITVGAMKTMDTPARTDDLIASYSSKGPSVIDHILKPDLVAPGNRVVSLRSPQGSLETSYPGNLVPLTYYIQPFFNKSRESPDYFTLSGTSMATPVVAAAAAILLQAHPDLTPDQVKARLMKTAYKTFPKYSIAYDPTVNQSFTSYYDVFTVGAGYLDIAAALANNSVFTGSALSPIVKHVKGSNGSSAGYVICSSASVCSSQAIAANQAIWGNAATAATSASSAQNAQSAADIVVYGEN